MDVFKRFIKFKIWVIIFTSVILLSCNDNKGELNQISKQIQEEVEQEVPDSEDDNSGDDNTGEEPPLPKEVLTNLKFCSRLELASIRWPNSLTQINRDSYALALNITGSYEGHSDWKNISNNFDDQGISLGIFQQNLGQGSLQPLLLQVDEENEFIFKQFFSMNQRDSLYGMLNRWKASGGLGLAGVQSKLTRDPAGAKENITAESLTKFYSPLDMDDEYFTYGSDNIFTKASNSANQDSVDWAINNLYQSNGKTFDKYWKRAFQGLAEDPRYVSKQVQAGHTIHKKAKKFMEVYNARELKSYLFFFDIVVQNGGIRESTRQKYLAEVNQVPQMSENDRMKVLIRHRVLRSRKQYRADVLSRKLAILNGKGLVHQSERDFREEFCTFDYDGKIK